MKEIILLIMLSPIIVSCDCDVDEQKQVLNGTYLGTFARSSPTGDWMSANVTLIFEANAFSGTSNLGKYPAICSGTFRSRRSEIDFENQCAWTAEFDWTFILDGKFEMTTTGNELILTREHGEDTYDQYRLTRQ